MSEENWLEGAISVTAAIEAESRDIEEVCVRRGTWSKTVRRVARLAERAGIPVSEVEPGRIDELSGGDTHGGVIARVGARRYQRLVDLLPANTRPIIAMLDGIEDPFNFGQAMRSLYAAGVHGVVVRKRSWLSAAGTVARASAGASERLRVAVADGPREAARFFRKHGLLVVCTGQNESISIYDADLTQPMFLLIGGEKRGVARTFSRHADLQLHIPYGRDFGYSLGTAQSTGILAFEIMRQRRQGAAASDAADAR